MGLPVNKSDVIKPLVCKTVPVSIKDLCERCGVPLVKEIDIFNKNTQTAENNDGTRKASIVA